MPENDQTTLRFLLPGVAASKAASRALGPVTRGGAADYSGGGIGWNSVGGTLTP